MFHLPYIQEYDAEENSARFWGLGVEKYNLLKY
jgi:hypothetical protein